MNEAKAQEWTGGVTQKVEINNLNSLHFQLGLALAALGVITSLVAQHMYSLPAYAFPAQDPKPHYIHITNTLPVLSWQELLHMEPSSFSEITILNKIEIMF